jgi:dTDP-4-amino-4,6-dideoxygalactose transaminase
MHLQPVFRQAAVCGGSVAEALFEMGLCLPSGSSLTAEDQQRVISSLHQLHTAAVAACVRA